MQLTLESDSPGCEEGFKQGYTRELRVLPEVCIQAEHNWLNS